MKKQKFKRKVHIEVHDVYIDKWKRWNKKRKRYDYYSAPRYRSRRKLIIMDFIAFNRVKLDQLLRTIYKEYKCGVHIDIQPVE